MLGHGAVSELPIATTSAPAAPVAAKTMFIFTITDMIARMITILLPSALVAKAAALEFLQNG